MSLVYDHLSLSVSVNLLHFLIKPTVAKENSRIDTGAGGMAFKRQREITRPILEPVESFETELGS